MSKLTAGFMIAKALNPLDTRVVTVGGLIGQRLEMTWRNNLLAIDWGRDFLAPFKAKDSDPGAYIGLGKSLDSPNAGTVTRPARAIWARPAPWPISSVHFNQHSSPSDLGLKPFPDPAGHATYFACADSPLMMDDERYSTIRR